VKPPRRSAIALSLVAVTVLAAIYVFGAQPLQTPARRVEDSPTPHATISIGGDADFTRIGTGSGCECVRHGVGTNQEPYLISAWVVNASRGRGIQIFGTSAHFVIRNVRVYGDSLNVGISLDRVENGKIEDSLISQNHVAIYAFASHDIAFVNNTISRNQYGILLEGSDNNLVSSNAFEEIEDVAIFVRGSDNVVRNNLVARGKFGGINIDGTPGIADGNVVESNLIVENASYGIGMWRATNCLVRGNVVNRNGVGIMLTDQSEGNLVERNNVTQSVGDGIVITEGSVGNIVRGNIARGNGDGVSAFDLHDMSLNNVWQDNDYSTKEPETLD